MRGNKVVNRSDPKLSDPDKAVIVNHLAECLAGLSQLSDVNFVRREFSDHHVNDTH